MFGKSDMAQQWSMRAEVRISNDAENGTAPAQDRSAQDSNSVRVVYTWTTDPTKESVSSVLTNATAEQRNRNPNTSYGFQRGNMTFTSTPPRNDPNRLGTSVQDSGYNSDHFTSPNFAQNPPRSAVPYDRRCRSTCSIVLSTDITVDDPRVPKPHQCNRAQSLRCQSPCIKTDRRDLYYGCGDPWCHHAEPTKRCSPVFESCEECKSNQSVTNTKDGNTFTTHFCTKLSEKKTVAPRNKKDMMTQTVETKEKSTSPLEKMLFVNNENKSDSELSKNRKKNVRKMSGKKKTSQSCRRSNYRPENTNIRRSIARSPEMIFHKSPVSENESRQNPSKKHTVHIDVYCTASDGESDSSSSVFNSEDELSAYTVFKNDQTNISHRRAGNTELPLSLKQSAKENIPSCQETKNSGNESNSEDECTTAYPSALSSYTRIRDFESSFSGIFPTLSASLSSCTLPEYNNSSASLFNNSLSDFEGLLQRGSGSDSTICKVDSSSSLCKSAGSHKLPYSDSFDYADSSDRERIKKMEQMWSGGTEQKTWKSPQMERKLILQQKIQEYLHKKLKDKAETTNVASESESDSSDSSKEQVSVKSVEENPEKVKVNLKRGSTVYKINKGTEDTVNTGDKDNVIKKPLLNPVVETPKTPFPLDVQCEPFHKAEKFGPVIGATRKPGRHVGPVKNPDCLCEHCKMFYEDKLYRNRTRSTGSLPFNGTYNWRNILRSHPLPKITDCSDY